MIDSLNNWPSCKMCMLESQWFLFWGNSSYYELFYVIFESEAVVAYILVLFFKCSSNILFHSVFENCLSVSSYFRINVISKIIITGFYMFYNLFVIKIYRCVFRNDWQGRHRNSIKGRSRVLNLFYHIALIMHACTYILKKLAQLLIHFLHNQRHALYRFHQWDH